MSADAIRGRDCFLYQCPVCGMRVAAQAALPAYDTPCPDCGYSLWCRKRMADGEVILSVLPNRIPQHTDIERLAEFNRGSAKTHSGVWRDLAVRKRKTEVDAQIGIIAELASDVQVQTPVIRRLIELVHDVEAGRRSQSMETFGELLAVCR